MAQQSSKVKYREINNQNQGSRTGVKVPRKPGPAKGRVGRAGKNKTRGGGINRPTKGQM